MPARHQKERAHLSCSVLYISLTTGVLELNQLSGWQVGSEIRESQCIPYIQSKRVALRTPFQLSYLYAVCYSSNSSGQVLPILIADGGTRLNIIVYVLVYYAAVIRKEVGL